MYDNIVMDHNIYFQVSNMISELIIWIINYVSYTIISITVVVNLYLSLIIYIIFF